MTVREAGKKGGDQTKALHKNDPEYYKKLGALGGAKTRDKYAGSDHFAAIGSKGGEQNALAHDREHFETIGKKGGDKVRDMIEKGRQKE